MLIRGRSVEKWIKNKNQKQWIQVENEFEKFISKLTPKFFFAKDISKMSDEFQNIILI